MNVTVPGMRGQPQPTHEPGDVLQPGSGTYVAEPRQRVRMVRSSARERPDGSPFRADMKALGRQGDWESRTDAKVPAPADIAARLGIAEGDLCVKSALVTHIHRTYYSDQGRPMETADIVVPAAHCEIVHEIPINRP